MKLIKEDKMSKQQKGFTLVEMAIVLVIIGLLLSGVLKGQELIENSRIKSAVNEVKSISAAYNGYFDRFQRLPGDDGPVTHLVARGGAWSSASVAGDNNGLLTVSMSQTFTGAAENAIFFSQLRYAGFLNGNPMLTGVDALPRNVFGGLTGVTGEVVFGLPPTGRYVCMGSVPGKASRAIDTLLDDGVANTGSLRAMSGSNNTPPSIGVPSTATYSDDNFYTFCTSL